MRMKVSGCVFLLLAGVAAAQPSEKLQDMLRRIFNSTEFTGGGGGARGGRGGGGGGARWMEGGEFYATVEPAPGGAGREIVRYDPATGKREVLVSAEQLTPKQTGKPLAFGEYAWSADGKKLLVGTNSHRVLIRKMAGEYWVLERASGAWRKLGGDNGAELLYPKFSPDATRVAFLRAPRSSRSPNRRHARAGCTPPTRSAATG